MRTRSNAPFTFVLMAAAVAALATAGPATASRAAAATGTAATGTWTISPAPSSGRGNDSLNAVAAISDAEAWAVGTTFTAPGATGVTAVPLVLRWNGTGWALVATPAVTVTTVLTGVAGASSTDAWAVGYSPLGYGSSVPVLVRWNGSAWSAATQPAASGALAAVADLGPGDAWAVGRSGRFGPQLIEHWNGTAWTTVSAPEPDPTYPAGSQLLAVSARAADDVWALGRSSTVGAYAEHWDGTAWSLSLMAAGSGDLPSGVVSLGPGNAWASVDTYNGGNAYVQHWNGTAWSVSTTRPAAEYPTLAGIIARSATDVSAVGGFLGNLTTSTPTREIRTLHFDGTAWTSGTAPNGDGVQLSGAAIAPGGARSWAVGTATGAFVLTRAG